MPTSWPPRQWLATQQNDLLGDGGFSSTVKGEDANVVDTALAIQALSAAARVGRLGRGTRGSRQNFLQTHQNDAADSRT